MSWCILVSSTVAEYRRARPRTAARRARVQEVTVSRRRYVARGVPGGYRVWDNRARRWWGDLYELCPDDLVSALNGGVSHSELTEALNRARALRR